MVDVQYAKPMEYATFLVILAIFSTSWKMFLMRDLFNGVDFRRSMLVYVVEVLHCILTHFFVSNPFVSSRFDFAYLTLVVLLIASWYFLKGECVFFYLESLLIFDGDYVMGSSPKWIDFCTFRESTPYFFALNLIVFWLIFSYVAWRSMRIEFAVLFSAWTSWEFVTRFASLDKDVSLPENMNFASS